MSGHLPHEQALEDRGDDVHPELERRARLAGAIGPCTIDATAHLLAIENDVRRATCGPDRESADRTASEEKEDE